VQRLTTVLVDPPARRHGAHKVESLGTAGGRTEPDLLIGRLPVDHVGAVLVSQVHGEHAILRKRIRKPT